MEGVAQEFSEWLSLLQQHKVKCLSLHRDPRRLVLYNVSKAEAGRYSCLATNEAGTLEQDITLHVMSKLKFVCEGNM